MVVDKSPSSLGTDGGVYKEQLQQFRFRDDPMNDIELISRLKKVSIKKQVETGIVKCHILQDELNKMSHSLGISIHDLEIISLEEGIIPERYIRNIYALSLEEQLKLLNSHVTVVGLGGLGGGVTEILARTGIGFLNLVDGDVFESHNLNRQYLATENNIGTSKAEAAEKRVKQINAGTHVRWEKSFLTEKNATSLLKDSHAVCDCLDTIGDRFVLEKAAKKLNIPVISGAVAGFSGQTLVIFPGDKGFESVFGDPETAPDKGSEKLTGTVSPAVTLIASLMCSDLVKVLLKKNTDQIQNRLRLVDLDNNLFESVYLE